MSRVTSVSADQGGCDECQAEFSDCTLRIFSVDGTTRYVLRGHTSRVWDCSMGPLTGGSGDGTVRGPLIASGSGDGTVRIWDDAHCRGILNGDGGDVYSVRWRRQVGG